MRARFLKVWQLLGKVFWILPSLIVLACAIAAFALLAVNKYGLVPQGLLDSPLIYSGDATGAHPARRRRLLDDQRRRHGVLDHHHHRRADADRGADGPRLLRNFTRDRGIQATLCVFLGTFSYALLILRTVRGDADGFTPHASLSFGVLLAFICVGMLIYFVEHIAGRINVSTVIDLVSADVEEAVRHLTVDRVPAGRPKHLDFSGGQVVVQQRRDYL